MLADQKRTAARKVLQASKGCGVTLLGTAREGKKNAKVVVLRLLTCDTPLMGWLPGTNFGNKDDKEASSRSHDILDFPNSTTHRTGGEFLPVSCRSTIEAETLALLPERGSKAHRLLLRSNACDGKYYIVLLA